LREIKRVPKHPIKSSIFTGAQKMIKSGGIPCLRVQAGRIGPIEAIFEGSYGIFGLVDTS
jgi:hypothetical protein